MKTVYIISILLLIVSFSSSQDPRVLDMNIANRVDSYTDTTGFTTDEPEATDNSTLITPFVNTVDSDTSTTSSTTTTTTTPDPTTTVPSKKKNLGLILGLSLGLGVPVLLGVIGGIVFYCYKQS